MTEENRFLCAAMEHWGDTVYRLALCRTQSQADAEDVYQDVFLSLLKQTHRDWEAGHLKAWLIRATLNRCHDLTRFRLRRPTLPLEAVSELAAQSSEAAELWEAVSRLPEKLRTAIHLHYAEGYQAEEIAEILRVPPSTVRTRLYRGRQQLKEMLGGLDDESERI